MEWKYSQRQIRKSWHSMSRGNGLCTDSMLEAWSCHLAHFLDFGERVTEGLLIMLVMEERHCLFGRGYQLRWWEPLWLVVYFKIGTIELDIDVISIGSINVVHVKNIGSCLFPELPLMTRRLNSHLENFSSRLACGIAPQHFIEDLSDKSRSRSSLILYNNNDQTRISE